MQNDLTVSEVLEDLIRRGYTHDLSLLTDEEGRYFIRGSHQLKADDFVIDEVHRFEGDSDPGDEMVLYTVSSAQYRIKGFLVDAYGIYSDPAHSELVEKIGFRNKKHDAPIRRAKVLVPLSRDHHHGLLLAWKIRTGISRNIELHRIRNYVAWFYEKHLLPHFETEEKFVFPLLGEKNDLREQAVWQHREISRLISKEDAGKDELIRLGEMLTGHIRFEERVLFNEIQDSGRLDNIVLQDQLNEQVRFCDNESDPFWKE